VSSHEQRLPSSTIHACTTSDCALDLPAGDHLIRPPGWVRPVEDTPFDSHQGVQGVPQTSEAIWRRWRGDKWTLTRSLAALSAAPGSVLCTCPKTPSTRLWLNGRCTRSTASSLTRCCTANSCMRPTVPRLIHRCRHRLRLLVRQAGFHITHYA